MDIRLIALDMDGTLLDHEQRISDENAEWIRRAIAEDIVVVLATGRAIFTVEPFVEQLELTSPMVLSNGSEVRKSLREVWTRHLLSGEQVRWLRELALRMDVWYWSAAVSGSYNRENWQRSGEDEQWLKFGYYTENRGKLETILAELEACGQFEITNSDPHNLEINPKGVSKASGLREICTRLGLTMDQVAAAGDSLNDLAMIREAGFGVAMGNAQDPVKRAADWITDTNVNNGVAKLIRKILKERG
jgi:hypothetical protein